MDRIDYAREPLIAQPAPGAAPSPEARDWFYDQAARLYQQFGRSVVQIRNGRESASGFFIDSDGGILTNWHAVNSSPNVEVLTTDGNLHPAKIEKLDDIHDMAIIRIDGIGKDQFSPLRIGRNAAVNQPEFALGHPLGDPRLSISPGIAGPVTTQLEAACHPASAVDLDNLSQSLNETGQFLQSQGVGGTTWTPVKSCAQQYQDLVNLLPKEQREDGQAWLKRETAQSLLPIWPGNSGGPIVDEQGYVVAMSRMAATADVYNSSGVPAERLRQFIAAPAKFEVKYQDVMESPIARHFAASLSNHPVTTTAESLAALGAVGAGMKYVPRGVMAGAAVAGSLLFQHDWQTKSELQSQGLIGSSKRQLQENASLLADAGVVLGAVSSFVPKLKAVGRAVALTSAAGRAALEFMPTLPVLQKIERSDGTFRPPLRNEMVPGSQDSK